MILDDIRLGPVKLELHDAVTGGLLICVYTDTEGKRGMGVRTTQEEWDELISHVGMSGMSHESV
jgi:hypothetical protein